MLLDDRDARPGFKFADADLIGFPGQNHHRRPRAEGRQSRSQSPKSRGAEA